MPLRVAARVELDQLESAQAVLGRLLAQQAGEHARVEAAAFGHAHARGEERVEHIEVEADAKATGGRRHPSPGFGQHAAQAAAADLMTGIETHAQPAQALGLAALDAAHADHAAIARVDHGGGLVADGGECRIAFAEQHGQRHAVQAVAGRGLRRVAVEVGVDPEQAEWAAAGLGNAAPAADGRGVVAADHHGQDSAGTLPAHGTGQASGAVGHAGHALGMATGQRGAFAHRACPAEARRQTACQAAKLLFIKGLRAVAASRVGATGRECGTDEGDAHGETPRSSGECQLRFRCSDRRCIW